MTQHYNLSNQIRLVEEEKEELKDFFENESVDQELISFVLEGYNRILNTVNDFRSYIHSNNYE